MRRAASLAAALLVCVTAPRVWAQEIPYQPQAQPPPGASTCPGGLCGAEALASLFQALEETETGSRRTPVHILQIGDSHTAGDRITGAVRAGLQGRFGNGGRGVLPAGAPYDGYAPYQVQVTAEGWINRTAPLTPRGGFQRAEVGLTGVGAPVYGRAPGLTLTFDPGAGADLMHRCGRAGQGFDMVLGKALVSFDLRSQRAGPVCERHRLLTGTERLEVRPAGPRALAYSLMFERDGPGVILSNLGVVGATLRDLAARDEAVAAAELAEWAPALIIVAFGTNEGFEDDLNPATYEALLRQQIARLKRLSPGSALMILGAPDALRTGVASPCSADGRRAPPPSLAVVRDVQRRVAADMGVAYWDWHGRMGGDCASDRLATMAEPLMRGDRVHFTSAGADWIGGVLTADLMAAYEAWKGEGR
jgi:lysophospholipase L1-like esterase